MMHSFVAIKMEVFFNLNINQILTKMSTFEMLKLVLLKILLSIL